MKVKQIYQLINSINKQMWGENAISVNDLRDVISLGETLQLNEDDADAFLGALVDRIGKTVIRTLDLELDFPNFFMDTFEFGAIMQKINVNPFESIENSDWKVGENDFTPTFADVYKPSVTVKYFKGATTWAYRVTIPLDTFFTAFTSAERMNTFIDAIMTALTDSMVLSINNMSRTALCELVAEKELNNNGVVDLLALYNGASGTMTVEEARRSKEFYRFAGMVIRNYIGYMKEPSKLYNIDGMVRTTARDNMHVIMLRDFASGYDAYLSSDTFHNELVNLPLYTEVNHWQGSGQSISFENNSKISVTPSSQSEQYIGDDEPVNVELNGVVCVLADRQSIGVGINKRRVGKFVNDIDDYVNTKTSATIQWFVDLSENAVVFTIGSSATDGE